MGSNLMRYWCVSITLFSALTLGQEPRTPAQTQDQALQVIHLTAKKYEYSPSAVHVKQGARVQLRITAVDRDHGFKIATVPDGAAPTGPVGLELASPQPRDSWKLQKGKETAIEFVAKTPGTYEFSCSEACGIHHGRMKGQLVVDP